MINGYGALAILLAIAALPTALSWLWLSLKKYPAGALWFFGALLAGGAALLAALILQAVLPEPRTANMAAILYKVFIKTALTEEGGKLLVLLVFTKVSALLPVLQTRAGESHAACESSAAGESSAACESGAVDESHAAATGFVAGLGFAMIETLSYAQVDLRIAILRGISAAPLHGACGARAGLGALAFRSGEIRYGILNFLMALSIHGFYNFFIIQQGIFPLIAIAFACLSVIKPLKMIKFPEKSLKNA
jgi:RsiW-degrading membrane proteinase PrsW (M82 family)